MFCQILLYLKRWFLYFPLLAGPFWVNQSIGMHTGKESKLAWIYSGKLTNLEKYFFIFRNHLMATFFTTFLLLDFRHAFPRWRIQMTLTVAVQIVHPLLFFLDHDFSLTVCLFWIILFLLCLRIHIFISANHNILRSLSFWFDLQYFLNLAAIVNVNLPKLALNFPKVNVYLVCRYSCDVYTIVYEYW